MKEIQLTRGLATLVDDADYQWLSRWKWCATKGHKTWYAMRVEGHRPLRKTILMHRAIMGDPDGIRIDHRDGNGLNNVHHNLREATRSQNAANRSKTAGNKSGYKGVWWERQKRKWKATIQVDGHLIHIGFFVDISEAAIAYDKAAREYFGEFAMLNFPDETLLR